MPKQSLISNLFFYLCIIDPLSAPPPPCYTEPYPLDVGPQADVTCSRNKRSPPMKAVVMAGGEGSRLRPLTINRPKPMVPLVDRVVMAHIIELLKIHGITDIVVTVQYLANLIQDNFGDGSAYGVHIDYSLEEQPLGTAGSVKNAEHLLREPLLVISGDALTHFDLPKILAFHNARHAMATITLTHPPHPPL